MPSTITPNMNLTVPTVGAEPGPAYANEINSDLTTIDSHNHTAGSGVPIPASGLNINADLPFNSNNATALRSVRFSPQGSAIVGPLDLGALYELGVDLYYKDGSGNNIRITQSGGIAGSPGSISGLTSPASATYNAGQLKFIWQSDVNKSASMDAGPYIMRNNTTSSNAVTISPPAVIGSNYSIVLFTLPLVNSVVKVDPSGNMTTQPLAYNITVGTGGDYSTMTAAIAAAPAGSTIMWLAGTYTENVIVNKNLNIMGQGYATILNGTLTFATGSDLSLFQEVKIVGNIAINTGVQGVQLLDFWTNSSVTVTDNGTGTLIQGIQE